ncbi:hypothetical protein GCM10011386_46990 [Parapedobacter defluvii]|uniref:Uncharacterized protein n=1 Tax=Parapedobacter defluvii TaxID=2045106 RepID=A0ABQ1MYV9_9SPHI|nr:hypothetical protein [Parapedobacter defluvii]GGC49296.1 hypothetical protein GCM10011386_46990 [Parapedobacter defluvii]
MENILKNHYAVVCTLLIGIAMLMSCSKDRDDDTTPPTEKQADVYVAGYQMIGSQSIASLWKNGIATTLTDNTVLASSANDVFVSGNDVYVAGAERLSSATSATARFGKTMYLSTLLLQVQKVLLHRLLL